MKNRKDFEKQFYSEFSEEEIRKLAGGPITTNTRMELGDKVYLKNEFLDYLCWFFDEVYDGRKIPVVFQQVCIEIQEVPMSRKYYVNFFEDHEDWYSIDVFIGGHWLFKLLSHNRDMTPDDWLEEEGRYWLDSVSLFNNNVITEHIPKNEIQQIATSAKNAFLYVYLYAYANKDNTEVVEVEQMSKREIGYEKKLSKKGNPILKKVRRTIPYTRRVFRFEKPTEKTETKAKEYLLSRWKVRGYTYTKKNGTVVNVREHVAQRHYPNKGVDKTQLGTDYYLKKPANPNDN